MTEYTGNVEVGGPADVRELPELTITKLAVGPMDNNGYLLRCRPTGEPVLVDAANDAPTAARADRRRRGCARVVTTHRHGDHWQALGRGRRPTGATHGARPRRRRRASPVPDRRTRRGRRRVAVGDVRARGDPPARSHAGLDGPAVPTTRRRPHLFTGDSLFPGGVGNTSRDSERFTLADRRRRGGSSTGCPTRPGSIRATATTPRSAPSARPAGVARPRLVAVEDPRQKTSPCRSTMGIVRVEVEVAAVSRGQRRQRLRVVLAAGLAELTEQLLDAAGRDDLQQPQRLVAGVPERVPLPARLEERSPGAGDDLLAAQERAEPAVEDVAVLVLRLWRCIGAASARGANGARRARTGRRCPRRRS